VKSAYTKMVLVIELALMSSGCASLRPPAQDREAWEAQQKQEETQNESAMEKDPVGMLLYYSILFAESVSGK
jgi:hypothetical protein